MFPFYTHENARKSFRWYKMGTLARNELIQLFKDTILY